VSTPIILPFASSLAGSRSQKSLFWSSTAASTRRQLFSLASCPLRGPLMHPGDKSTACVLLCCRDRPSRRGRRPLCESHATRTSSLSYTRAHSTTAGKRLGLANLPPSHPSASSSLSSRATAFFFWCCTGCQSPHVERTILIPSCALSDNGDFLVLRVLRTRFHSFSAYLLDCSARLRHSSVRRQPHLSATAHNALSLATKRRLLPCCTTIATSSAL